MNITAATAHADQLAAALVDARCCDAIDPCADCRAKRTEIHAIRHAARVAALVVPAPTVTIPRPRRESVLQRLAAAASR